ncbi:hypothetical protein BGZ76_000527 [Entomortierella beljakovae]|nr:hypothetical protein BGZ76_000527 [Entomortierella beljakovae]
MKFPRGLRSSNADSSNSKQVNMMSRSQTFQVTGENTDNIFVVTKAITYFEDYESSTLINIHPNQKQTRAFIHSCLVKFSNHHNIDTTMALKCLASGWGCEILSDILKKPMSIHNTDYDGIYSFQRTILPFIGVLTRENVCQSMIRTLTDRIFKSVYDHQESFFGEVMRCMNQMRDQGTIDINDTRSSDAKQPICRIDSIPMSLLAIIRLVYQLLVRIPESRIMLSSLVSDISSFHNIFETLPANSPATQFVNEILIRDLTILQKIVAEAQVPDLIDRHGTSSWGLNPSGTNSLPGSRHSNDHASISKISIFPTLDELGWIRGEYLPFNGIPNASHFMPNGWSRHLDTHFRLYREDLVRSHKEWVQVLAETLKSAVDLDMKELLDPKELRCRFGPATSLDLYGPVKSFNMNCNTPSSVSIIVIFQQPQQARRRKRVDRVKFWNTPKVKLMEKSLVFLVGCNNVKLSSEAGRNDVTIIPAIISTRKDNNLSFSQSIAQIEVSLGDPKLYVELLHTTSIVNTKEWYLVQVAGSYFEAYRPVLRALQTCIPATMPFGKYIAPTDKDIQESQSRNVAIEVPFYTKAPGFLFDLSVLLNDNQQHYLDPSDGDSIQDTVQALESEGSLDATQSRALVDSLCREIALVQGPPGTGKTRLGVALMRVLLHNRDISRSGPIICICYTNHALDQFLEHLLDVKVSDIVRLGSRSKSDRLKAFNLGTLMRRRGMTEYASDIRHTISKEWLSVSNQIRNLQMDIRSEYVPWSYVQKILKLKNPNQCHQFEDKDDKPIVSIFGSSKGPSFYTRWLLGLDIKAGPQNRMAGTREKSRMADPGRPLEQLDGDIWEMLMNERMRLHESWGFEARKTMSKMMERLVHHGEEISTRLNESFDESRRQILRDTSVIGMTTNGAARYRSLLKSLSPKIILCEEAGEVVESNILSVLSDSTQHLIMIGDHLQLRPSIGTYNLSADSKLGKNYNLDISLFERLVTNKERPLPMSSLTTQRRMRPEISSLIRNTVYSNLVDGEKVISYPPVAGISQTLYFMDHTNPEEARVDLETPSFSNLFEVRMVQKLVQYLIRNGYDKPGDIAVLTPYLTQLQKMQVAMNNVDTIASEDDDGGKSSTNDNSKEEHPILRTIDSFQGEEAKIVIVSLVRNNTAENGLSPHTKSRSIGFLKSSNRTNVLLSRAQHGMFLLGNASQMEDEGNGIWPQIIKELRDSGRVGAGFPIFCQNHPNVQEVVTGPELFKSMSPDGGCRRLCHPDDSSHEQVVIILALSSAMSCVANAPK